jgi:hypothetical protein
MAAGVDAIQLALIIFGLIQRFQTPSNFELDDHYIYPENLGLGFNFIDWVYILLVGSHSDLPVLLNSVSLDLMDILLDDHYIYPENLGLYASSSIQTKSNFDFAIFKLCPGLLDNRYVRFNRFTRLFIQI